MALCICNILSSDVKPVVFLLNLSHISELHRLRREIGILFVCEGVTSLHHQHEIWIYGHSLHKYLLRVFNFLIRSFLCQKLALREISIHHTCIGRWLLRFMSWFLLLRIMLNVLCDFLPRLWKVPFPSMVIIRIFFGRGALVGVVVGLNWGCVLACFVSMEKYSCPA